MAPTAILNMSGFLLRLVRHKVPAACCEHLAGTAWLAGQAREGHLLPTPRRRADNAIWQAFSLSSCLLVPLCGFLSCQDNNVYIRLRRVRAKTQLRSLVNGRS